MKWFNNLKISEKLTIGFVIITAITVILGYTGYSWTTEVVGEMNTMYLNRLVPIKDLGNANDALLTLRGDFVASLGTNDLTKRQEYINSIKNKSDKVDELIDKYSKTVLVKEEQESLLKFLYAWNAYKKYHGTVINDILNMQDDQAKEIIYVDSLPSMLNARKYLNELIDLNAKVANELHEEANTSAQKAKTNLFIFIMLSAAGALGLGIFISKTVSKKINKAVLILQELGKGHLGKRLNIDTKDEVGVMAKMMNQFADDLQNFVVGSMIRISEGDFNFEIPLKDKDDEITPALNLTTKTLKELKKETDIMTAWAKEGDLEKRGNTDKFKGGYSEIISGFNNTVIEIVTKVRESENILAILSTGDLTARMEGEYKGNYKKFQTYVNNLANSLEDVIGEVNESIATTASSANEISSSTEEMAAGAEEQSQQATEVAGAVEQMTKTIIETTKNSGAAAEASKKYGEIAKEGGNVVNETIKGMNRISEVVQNSAETVQQLGKSSEHIGEIVQVIDDIADQTNLLALNAAIEAARAGEQGRGFAVVADEVRKLAERTTKATKEIASMIKQIQKDTKGAVASMEKGSKEVENGRELANKAGESLKEIIAGAEDVVDIISQVAAASEEQSTTSEQISRSIESISSVTQQSAAGVQQVAKATEDLSRLTDNLQNLVNKFKISKGHDSDKGDKYAVRQNRKLIKV
jgi:methyl-accepting chemotaxis protein